MFSLMWGKETNRILVALLKLTQNRFSYRYVHLAKIETEIVGIVLLVPIGSNQADSDYAKVLNWWQRWRWLCVEQLILKRIIKSDYPEGSYYLANLAVKPQYRDLGVGSELLQYCYRQAGEQGAKALWISVSIDNPRAQKLYEKQGFQVKETKTMSIGGKIIGTRALVRNCS